MPNYIRNFEPGGTYFFTVNALVHGDNDLFVKNFELLRDAFARVRSRRPFSMVAWVVLPGHLHCIWTLPPGDADYPARWRAIKSSFSRSLDVSEFRNSSRQSRNERGIWQRRFHEHTIRDERNLSNHIDYIHYNPVKHKLAKAARDWPHSSFHRFVREGTLALDWAAPPALELNE